MKFIITGMPSSSGESPQVLVKVNEKSATALELDSLVQLRDCEVRPSWRNPAGVSGSGIVGGEWPTQPGNIREPAGTETSA